MCLGAERERLDGDPVRLAEHLAARSPARTVPCWRRHRGRGWARFASASAGARACRDPMPEGAAAQQVGEGVRHLPDAGTEELQLLRSRCGHPGGVTRRRVRHVRRIGGDLLGGGRGRTCAVHDGRAPPGGVGARSASSITRRPKSARSGNIGGRGRDGSVRIADSASASGPGAGSTPIPMPAATAARPRRPSRGTTVQTPRLRRPGSCRWRGHHPATTRQPRIAR